MHAFPALKDLDSRVNSNVFASVSCRLPNLTKLGITLDKISDLDRIASKCQNLTSLTIKDSSSKPPLFEAGMLLNVQFVNVKVLHLDCHAIGLYPVYVLSHFPNLYELILETHTPLTPVPRTSSRFHQIIPKRQSEFPDLSGVFLGKSLAQSVRILTLTENVSVKCVQSLLEHAQLYILRISVETDTDMLKFIEMFPFPRENPSNLFIKSGSFSCLNGQPTQRPPELEPDYEDFMF